jgi:S1-C subfamily serine protease
MVALSTMFLCAALTANSDAVLLEFYSPACGPCQSMQPTIQRLQKDGYPIQQINVEQAPEVARQFNIRHVPTCVLVIGGQEVGRLDGVRSRDEIERLFQQAAAQQATQQVASQAQSAEEYVVRGQSPEARRGLGLFSKLSGKKAAEPGEPPVAIPAGAGASQPEATFGRDDAFARRAAGPISANVEQPQPQPAAQPITSPSLPTTVMMEETPGSNGSPTDFALAATVRLKVEDPAGVSFGTGTIIDVLRDEALVVTCGHIFRDSKGQGKILVDLNVPGVKQPVTGQLISFDLTRDIALVSIRPGVEVKAVAVEGDPRRIVEGTRVFSIGCDGGKDPSVHESRVTAVDKYVGSPNYTVSGMPVQGRSGGGLFLADGTLVGICNAADEKDNEGLYAGLGTIHWQLDQIGQTAIYQRAAKAEATAVASAAAPRNEIPPAANLSAEPAPAPYAANVPPLGSDKEIIVIVRDRNRPDARSEAIVVPPTPELLDLLSRASRPEAEALPASGPQPTAMRALPDEGPIVRGQNK